MIRRPPRSTQSRSSAASDVYKRQVTSRASQTLRGSSRLSTWKRGEVVLAEGLHQGGRLVAGGAVERLEYRLAGKVADRVVRRAHRLGYPSGRGWPAEKLSLIHI